MAKIRLSQVFWEPIKNRASPRSALLKAVYLEALLYFILHAQPEIQFLKRLLRAYPDGTLLLSEKGTYKILMQKLKFNKKHFID